MGEWLQPFSPSSSSSFYLEVPSYENLICFTLLALNVLTEDQLPMITTPSIHPTQPTYSIEGRKPLMNYDKLR